MILQRVWSISGKDELLNNATMDVNHRGPVLILSLLAACQGDPPWTPPWVLEWHRVHQVGDRTPEPLPPKAVKHRSKFETMGDLETVFEVLLAIPWPQVFCARHATLVNARFCRVCLGMIIVVTFEILCYACHCRVNDCGRSLRGCGARL